MAIQAYKTNPSLELRICPECQGKKAKNEKLCRACDTKAVTYQVGESDLSFSWPLSMYHIRYRVFQDIIYKAQVVIAALLAVGAFGLFGYIVSSAPVPVDIFDARFWLEWTNFAPFWFWVGLMFVCFIVYRVMRQHKPVQHLDSNFPPLTQEERAEQRSYIKHVNIEKVLDPAAKQVIEQTYEHAVSIHATQVTVVHVLYHLLETREVQMIFARLGLPASSLKESVASVFQPQDAHGQEPIISKDVWNAIYWAYHEALISKQKSIGPVDLLSAIVKQSEGIQEWLYAIEVELPQLEHVVEWARTRERLRQYYSHVRVAASSRNKHGLDKAMTAVATPYLDRFSKDMTRAVMYGHVAPCVARDTEIEDVFRVVQGGRNSVVLVGQRGVGKRTLIQGIVQRMIEDDVPERLKDKRLVELSTTALLAGTTVSGAQERLLNMMHEVIRAKNVILFINNIDNLMGGNTDMGGFDVSESLAQFLQSGVLLFATTTSEGYNRRIANSQIGSTLARVDVNEMNNDQAIQVLEANAGLIEYKQEVFFSYRSLAAAVEFASRFLHDRPLPESAIELLSESASAAKNKKGEHAFVQKDDVAAVVAQKTGVPVTTMTSDESQKLLKLEEAMHQRVIGQEEAVKAVANALRRARAEIRSTKRPIATFLFLGSTGVGKTELTKTIAEVYFGGENRMIRLDMSEYQDASSVYRLIGQPGQQGTGQLTEAVRQQPFSLILLDEMEKAHPGILDLFLQVFDDGRLTDSVGRVIDFTNTIIISTSNAGTSFIQEGIRNNMDPAAIREQLIRGPLREQYRPEFLNRFDGVVVFTPLTKDHVKQIAGLMLNRVAKDLEQKGIGLKVTEQALEELAVQGYDPEFGARPMRRAIQDLVENKLADLLLSGQVKRQETVVFDGKNGVRVE